MPPVWWFKLQLGEGEGHVYVNELYLTATECHLSYEITQCYLPPDASEHTPP